MARITEGGISLITANVDDVEAKLNNYTLQDIAKLIAGKATVNVAGSGDYTLGVTGGMESDKRTLALILTGALTGTRNVLTGTVEVGRLFIAYNTTTGAHTLNVKVTSGGAGVAVPQNEARLLWHDGTTVREIGGAASVPPQCQVYSSVNVSIPNNALTAVSWDQERWDNNSIHSPSTNPSRVTLNKVGLWEVNGNIVFAANATGQRAAQIQFNGNINTRRGGLLVDAAGGSLETQLNVNTEFRVAAVTEYAELVVYQNSGGALNVTPVSELMYFGCRWISD